MIRARFNASPFRPGQACIIDKLPLTGTVIAVACDSQHRFSKPRQNAVTLLAGLGVEGDAHAGVYVRHRYLARRQPRGQNLRQVHLIACELFDVLATLGYVISPGDMGENFTTRGLELEHLPLGTQLHLGGTAVVEITGLRTPCVLLDRFSAGLKRHLIQENEPTRYRCGVLAIARAGGQVMPGDPVRVALPHKPWTTLPAL
jgi:MOSC domain-containing protein YiiM